VTTFALIPGAGGAASYWHRVLPLLEAAGHEALAVGLPGADERAGLPEYADVVTSAIGDRRDVVIVAQSLGGFTAAMVATRVPVRELVFVNAMIPNPGETPGAWWDNTGAVDARVAAAQTGGYAEEFDPFVYFLHDIPPGVLAEGDADGGVEADAVFGCACEFDAWPDVPKRVLVGSNDRFFPPEFQRVVARDRLGVDVDLLPGGHLIALAQPTFVAEYLLR
jgi:pimeloyl-ACP methyl ester carboxylesterase